MSKVYLGWLSALMQAVTCFRIPCPQAASWSVFEPVKRKKKKRSEDLVKLVTKKLFKKEC